MKEFNYKIMNENHISEIHELMQGEHSEAIAAYGLECVNSYKAANRFGTVIGVGVTGLIAGLGYLGVKGYRKWKDNRKTKNEKPAYDFMHV